MCRNRKNRRRNWGNRDGTVGKKCKLFPAIFVSAFVEQPRVFYREKVFVGIILKFSIVIFMLTGLFFFLTISRSV